MEIDKTIERFFKDNFAVDAIGIELIDCNENFAKCKFDVKPIHLNGDGVVMGGCLYAFADYTFAIAGNYKRVPTVSLNGSINFLSPANAKTLYAEAHIIKDGRTTCVGYVNILDDKGKIFATYNGTGYRKI